MVDIVTCTTGVGDPSYQPSLKDAVFALKVGPPYFYLLFLYSRRTNVNFDGNTRRICLWKTVRSRAWVL